MNFRTLGNTTAEYEYQALLDAWRMRGGNAGRPPTHGRYTKVAIAQRQRAWLFLRTLLALMR